MQYRFPQNAETVPPAHAVENISLDIRCLEFRHSVRSLAISDETHLGGRDAEAALAIPPRLGVAEQYPSAAVLPGGDCRKQKGRPESRPSVVRQGTTPSR